MMCDFAERYLVLLREKRITSELESYWKGMHEPKHVPQEGTAYHGDCERTILQLTAFKKW